MLTDTEAPRRAPFFIEMQSVAWCAAGQSRGQRGRTALEIRPRATNAVAVDHDAGIAESHVFSAHRRHDGLIVHAGIGHENAHPGARRDGAPVDVGHLFGLSERLVVIEIDPTGIGDHGDRNLRPLVGQLLEEGHAGDTDRFRIGHHMRLTDRNEIRRVESPADLDLMIDGPALRRPHLAGEHRLFFRGQLHAALSLCSRHLHDQCAEHLCDILRPPLCPLRPLRGNAGL